jgi:D-alanyl-D-alanine endopeptidase (penicillin-binding protein 7)
MMHSPQVTQTSPQRRSWFRMLGACVLVAALSPAQVEAAGVAKGAAKKNDKKAAKPGAKNTGRRDDKKSGKTRGRRTGRASQPPRHHHSEKRVAAMKGNLPNVQSLGALVIDLDTGQELFARKPDQPRSIASISKLAAALTVMDRNLDLDGLVTIKHVDAEVARGGARSRLLEGMTLSNRDLLHAALLSSDNRAVSALGRAVGLGTMPLTAAMNRKVASLGLRYTRFREPTGLSADNQSTPRETILLLKAAMAHPVLGPIVRRPEYDAHPVSKPPIHYVSTDRPAARANVQILGGKTGYNDSARYCLVIAVQIAGHSYGMSLLGSEGDLTRFGDVARIADWIVAHKPKPRPSSAPQGPPAPEMILDLQLAPDGGAADVAPLLGAK